MVRHWQELIILIMSLIFGGIVSGVFLNLMGVSIVAAGTDTSKYLINAITTQLFMFIGSAFLYFKITKFRFRDYIAIRGLTKRDGLHIAVFFVLAICFVLAISPLTAVIESTYSDHAWVEYQQTITELQNKVIGDLRGSKIFIALAVFALLPAVAEEIVFRGLLYRILKDLANKRHLAMFLSALVFSIFHFQVLSFLPILVIGYLLAALYERTQNLVAAIILHFAFNAVQIIFWQA